ncbi:MAG: hypothetical protein KF725_01385 [Cyclobacteriaceae bacterium]|nr:hypothetical protein [Cyclobacteriaceae bacterium]UYN86896.1 MAG: hypothetical protein KIT51_01020 [Cyclobacteriaceae bacterium]
MFVPFNTLPDSARVWIYQSTRKFTAQEQNTISTTLHAFTSQWSAHNQPLKSSFAVLHDHFIVLAVDESNTGASGCSIDSSVAVVRQLCNQLQVDLLNRTTVMFLVNHQVMPVAMADLKKTHEEGLWNSETIVMDNTVPTKGRLLSDWMRKANETWLKRYLPAAVI